MKVEEPQKKTIGYGNKSVRTPQTGALITVDTHTVGRTEAPSILVSVSTRTYLLGQGPLGEISRRKQVLDKHLLLAEYPGITRQNAFKISNPFLHIGMMCRFQDPP